MFSKGVYLSKSRSDRGVYYWLGLQQVHLDEQQDST